LTSRGRVLLILGVAMVIFGRVLALREFVMAGAALLIVLAAGAVSVLSRRGSVRLERRMQPPRTTAGAQVRVDLRVIASGRLGGGPVLASDRLPRPLGSPVRVTLPPAHTGRSERSVSYTLAPTLRGRYRIGPLELNHTDPFGAFQRSQEVAGRSVLLVYPSFEPITAIPSGVQRLGVIRRSPLVGSGDEFYSLRAYEEGDDLRKVHWPSSAKLGELVIRQEELTGEPRALIVLDTGARKHRGQGASSSLEAAVSACASVATLAVRNRMRVEILTPDGRLLQGRHPSKEDVLESLAIVRSSKGDLVDTLGGAQRGRITKAAVAVLITPGLSPEEARLLPAVVAGAPGGAVVAIDADSFVRTAQRKRPSANLARLGFPVVTLRAGDSFKAAWQKAMRDVALAR
jgi:uncharacterized protein (DUF58 family)